MIITFQLFKEFGIICLTLLAMGFCGGWLLFPFRNKSPYLWLAAPQAGILALAVCLSVAYNYHISIARALYVCVPVLGFTTLFLYRKRAIKFIQTRRNFVVAGLLIALCFTFLTTRETCSATIHCQGTGLLLKDGSDQMGYTHMADWVKVHTRNQIPSPDINTPYSSNPAWEFISDHRFGTFYLLAAASVVRGHTAAFSFDYLCGVLLASGILALAAVVCTTRISLVLTLLGLSVSIWLDYSRTGFLGKLLGYSSSLLVISLCISESRPLGRFRFPALGFICIGATITHSYLSTVCMIVATGIGYPIAWAFRGFRVPREEWDQLLTLVFVTILAIATSGFLGQPPIYIFNYPDWNFQWPQIWPRLFELDALSVRPDNLSAGLAVVLVWIAALIHAATLAIAIWKKSTPAIALLFGPIVIVLGTWILDARAEPIQMIGLFFPMFMVALAILLNKSDIGRFANISFRALIAIAILSIAIRLFHFKTSIDRYCRGNNTHAFEYAMADFDKIQAVVGNEELYVDCADPLEALLLLVDLGGRNMKLQWSPTNWDFIVLYRHWPAPMYPHPAKFRIVSANMSPAGFEEVFHTNQYRLMQSVSH